MLTNAWIWVRRADRGWSRKVDMRKLGLTEQIIKKKECTGGLLTRLVSWLEKQQQQQDQFGAAELPASASASASPTSDLVKWSFQATCSSPGQLL